VGRSHPEVRHPGPHEIEHVAVDSQFLVEGTDRGDGVVVDMRHEPGNRVEVGVRPAVGAVEEARRERLDTHR
jgi:hypothetical protein